MNFSNLEIIITKGAIIAGAGFFLWKVIAGWLVVNMQIIIEVERQAKTDNEDLLAFKILFNKGSTDTLQIKDIQARVRTEEHILHIISFQEVNKLSTNKNKLNWNENDLKGRRISLSPGESFHLGRFVVIPADKPVIVEAALHGTRIMWGKGFQWRGSIASLPSK